VLCVRQRRDGVESWRLGPWHFVLLEGVRRRCAVLRLQRWVHVGSMSHIIARIERPAWALWSPFGILSVAESCAGVDCGEGKKCMIRRGRPKCVCSPDCRKNRHKGPVCGTDGRSYTSVCRLRKRSCRKKNAALTVAYYGHCQSKSVLVSCHHLAQSFCPTYCLGSSRSLALLTIWRIGLFCVSFTFLMVSILRVSDHAVSHLEPPSVWTLFIVQF
jgi:hypothetical protein